MQVNVRIDEEDSDYVFFFDQLNAALAPVSQSGCERGNIIYNLFKNKLSSTMKLSMVVARLRIHINCHSIRVFGFVSCVFTIGTSQAWGDN